ncbi:hypothetical protein B0H11DRAFT_2067040 [Mycena galericulata]|nr:hypothetical protein B0H11DRAFT_2067040 [Mycena galericulata]
MAFYLPPLLPYVIRIVFACSKVSLHSAASLMSLVLSRCKTTVRRLWKSKAHASVRSRANPKLSIVIFGEPSPLLEKVNLVLFKSNPCRPKQLFVKACIEWSANCSLSRVLSIRRHLSRGIQLTCQPSYRLMKRVIALSIGSFQSGWYRMCDVAVGLDANFQGESGGCEVLCLCFSAST